MPRIIKTVQSLPKPERLLNVAAYARVSSGKDAMLRSLSAQVSFYSSMIQNHKGWNYVGVYSDEAITGTKETRENFQRLLNDCRNGRIDLVITKSISRFARNTVTLLKTVRELKYLGVDVYFEEQNIHTISAEGELMLTILASYAQEESLSVSENCKWKIRKNFENGISNTFSLYGYEKINGKIVINQSEANVVRYIFSLYLSGIGTTKISKILREQQIPSPCGSSWSAAALRETLKNEKYTGNMMLQKYYSKDHLSKRTLKNNGVLPKYYAEDTHPAIISQSDFDKVQMLFAERTKDTDFKRYDYDFKGMVFCGCCGWRYRRKKNYKKYVWRCGNSCNNGKDACLSKQIPESILYKLAGEITDDIAKIIILPKNNVKFILSDKTEILKHWVQPSRAESWTDEMKLEASKASKERSRNHADRNKN